MLGQLKQSISGAPDNFLTGLLIFIAVIAVVIALRGDPIMKAATAAWMIAP